MVEQSAEEIRKLLDAGTWLSTGQVAKLFGADPSTIHRWIKAGRIKFRRTPGGFRECAPADVQALLTEYETVRGGPDVPDAPPSS